MSQYKITNNEKLLNPITDPIDKDLNDAASKSLVLEKFSKSKQLQDYRSDFYNDYQVKQKDKEMESLRNKNEQSEYIKLCHDNSNREIRNENDFKQKFIDIDNKQAQYNTRFEKSVIPDQMERVKQKDAITQDKPSYIDRLSDDSSKYLSNRTEQMKNVYEFQKDRINEKYKQLSTKASTVTKMGEMSEQELEKFRNQVFMEKLENKQRQSDYAQFLTTQVKSKKWEDKSLENEDMNASLGKYKLSRNSSVPMIPGISNASSLLPKIPNFRNFNKISKNKYEQREALKELRSSYETLPSTMDMGNSKTRNNFDAFRGNIPAKTVEDFSKSRLKMSGLSTLKKFESIEKEPNQSNIGGSYANMSTELPAAGKFGKYYFGMNNQRNSNTFISTFQL